MTPLTSSATTDQLTSKRRASRACVSCRTRKVRCDYLQGNNPCTNCRIDHFDCEVAPKKKRRRRVATSRTTRTVSNLAEDTEAILLARPQAQSVDQEQIPNLQTGDRFDDGYQNFPDPLPPAPTGLSQHRILHQVPHYAFLIGLTQDPAPKGSGVAVHGLGEEVYSSLQTREGADSASPNSRCGQDELFFLQSTGCLNLPDQVTMSGFILAYFEFFHPFFPIVSKPAFLGEFLEMDIRSDKGPSLLLLRAILFIASGLVSTELLHSAGFDSRRDARESLYKKTRYLYDLDYESDSITIIQSLLLMSHYYPSITEKKHTWHWVHQAISMAQVAGLHRNPGQTSDRSLCCRIWWGCLIRDRLNSLGTSRPMMINSLDCDIPILTMDDLQEPEDDEMQYAVKLMFVELVKLCQYIEGVLSLRHDVMPSGDAPLDQIKVCDETLHHWLENLPPAARRQEPGLLDTGKVNTAALYRAVLHAAYNTVILALHGPSTLSSTPGGRAPESQLKVNLAARDSTQLFLQLVTYDLVRYCPTTCVTFVLPPLIVHLLELRASPTPELKQANSNRFDLCMMFLRQLRDVYWHASFYYEFFELAASIDTPSSAPPIGSQDPLIKSLTQKLSLRNQGIAERGTGSVPGYRHPPSGYFRALQNFNQLPLSQSSPIAQTVLATKSPEGCAESNEGPSLPISDMGSPDASTVDVLGSEGVQFEQWLEAYGNMQQFFPLA
ncbi:hypothetical protein V500_01572 [Pseudogymnoascus sp. VKM F-4518 (FW-2643)]|nr:hypothetical protein V500_01572 [Pseudogymnoascus sp. VKM F-4518 (FW-2643)]